MTFECSGASSTLPGAVREALECFLLWQYRLEHGSSTLCNHGRFHPGYAKSRDRSSDVRGGRLPAGQTNPAGGPSMAPLQPHGQAVDVDWMGLRWALVQGLRASAGQIGVPAPGIYKLLTPEAQEVLYIGETRNLRNRLRVHASVDWGCEAVCSWVALPDARHPYQRHEMENDLIGSYYGQTRTAPRFQFANGRRRGASDGGGGSSTVGR